MATRYYSEYSGEKIDEVIGCCINCQAASAVQSARSSNAASVSGNTIADLTEAIKELDRRITALEAARS